MRLMYDTEGNGLYQAWNSKKKAYHPQITKFWVISLMDMDTRETWTFDHSQGDNWWLPALEMMSNATELLCHNQIDFDLIALRSILGWTPPCKIKITDTLVLSRLLNPDREFVDGCGAGPHSVEAWGRRLGLWKPEQEQWLKFEPSMINRCQKDVEIQVAMYEALMQEKGRHSWNQSIAIEHESARIMTQQRLNGVYIDKEHTDACISDLSARIDEVSSSLSRHAPTIAKQYGVVVDEPYTKQGRLKVMVTNHWLDMLASDSTAGIPDISGSFCRIEWHSINLNSYPQLNEWLLSVGWQPTEYNYKKVTEKESEDPESPFFRQRPKQLATDADGQNIRTSPKLTEDSFDSIPGVIGEEIKARFRYGKRLGLFTGVMAAIRSDGRVPALVNPLGTNTSRMKHQIVANIPKALSDKKTHELLHDLPITNSCFYGVQCREMFCAPEGRVFVGHDASGIELRMLAHYINNEEFTHPIVNGSSSDGTDVHSMNQKAAGLPNRDMAKTMIYAINYGAGKDTLAKQLEVTPAEADQLKKKFLDANPLIVKLIKHVKKASKKGYLKGLDGRKVPMRSFEGRIQEHKALNTLLQSAGSVVMTNSRVILDQWVRDEGLDVVKVIDMHDEAQADVAEKDVERYMELAELSIVEAGKRLKLNLPLAAEAKRGKNWAETH